MREQEQRAIGEEGLELQGKRVENYEGEKDENYRGKSRGLRKKHENYKDALGNL